MPHHNNPPRSMPERKKRVAPLEDAGEWKVAPANQNRLTALPPEIYVKILNKLNPIDTVCLSLANKYLYMLLSPLITSIPLTIGGPDSPNPVIKPTSCRHCAPVLYYPAHCELQFHLRQFMPKEWEFCSSCAKFTRCEDKGFSDSHEFCGVCGTNYRKRFERGRRMLDMGRQDDGVRFREWYNEGT